MKRSELDVLVIGAGFSGLYAVHLLREKGFDVHGYERGSGVGGTWFWNRYPGARCDCESMYYSYSWLPDLEQEWPLEERFPAQPQLLAYLEHVAERLNLTQDFTFDTNIERMSFDPARERWTVVASNGEEIVARFVLTAVGCLSAANLPDVPGMSSFAGTLLHTASWPHDGVDLSGQRVGVIGTGASGIQSIPVIAEQAEHVTVFQRTAQFAIPAGNGPLSEQFVALWKANYREWRRRGRRSPGGIPYPRSIRSALEVEPQARERIYEAGWKVGGPDFPLSFGDIMLDAEANATAADFVREKIAEIVHDPETAERLKPRDFAFGAKRLPLDTNYYATFNRPNVALVDLKATPIEEITPAGVRTTTRTYPLDVLVLATGFDAMTGPLTSIDIHGSEGGRTLAETWREGFRSFLGLAVPGFPNLFTITGPGSPSVLVNMPTAIEQHVEWIVGCLEWLRQHEVTRIEADTEAAEAWTNHVQDVAGRTMFAHAQSWYRGANVPGKAQLFMPYLGGMAAYEDKCDAVAAAGYEDFVLGGVRV